MKTATKTKTATIKKSLPSFTCCICQQEIHGEWGENPEPLHYMGDGENKCCRRCDEGVTEARIACDKIITAYRSDKTKGLKKLKEWDRMITVAVKRTKLSERDRNDVKLARQHEREMIRGCVIKRQRPSFK